MPKTAGQRIRASARMRGDMWVWVAIELVVGLAPASAIILATDWPAPVKVGAAATAFAAVVSGVWLLNRRLHP